jgi:hypothetical protein
MAQRLSRREFVKAGAEEAGGGVAALESVRTPSLVAKNVLEQTDHHLIAGKGAQSVARGLGLKIEDDLNTDWLGLLPSTNVACCYLRRLRGKKFCGTFPLWEKGYGD